jgi:hypothetical protein
VLPTRELGQRPEAAWTTICGIAPSSNRSTRQQAPSDGRSGTSSQPLTTLRGAAVEVDVRRATHLIVALCLTALGIAVLGLFMAGLHKNTQDTLLRQQGLAVEVTVTGCRGLLGGSGSNAAGDTCRGTFVLDGRRYNDTIPGDIIRAPGTTVRLVTAESDPEVIATAQQVNSEHASWKVFILPSVLMVVLVALVAAATLSRRRNPGAISSGDCAHVGTSPTPPASGVAKAGYSACSYSACSRPDGP